VQWERPTNVKEVRTFLGMAGYYQRFMKDFSIIDKHLTQLSQNNVRFVRTQECE
jgi:hypothetical protein